MRSIEYLFILSLILIIVGGTMFFICKDAGTIEESFDNETIIVNMDCGGNENIAKIGLIINLFGSICLSLYVIFS